MPNKLTLSETVIICMENLQLIHEWERLTGRSLFDKRRPIEKLIDEATGYDMVEFAQFSESISAFIDFVKDCIWDRLPPEIRE